MCGPIDNYIDSKCFHASQDLKTARPFFVPFKNDINAMPPLMQFKQMKQT